MSPGGVAVAATGVALLLLAAGTARRPAAPVPDRDGYFDRWRDLHGGYDLRTGSRVARGWLSGVFALCRPLARAGVQPDAVTLVAVWVCGLAALLAGGDGAAPAWAALVVTAGSALDNADGCVAVLTDRATPWGYVLDSAADRVADLLVLLALVRAGGSAGVAVAAGAVLFLLEYLRARAVGAGVREVGVVSVGERPGRLIAAVAGLLAAGLAGSHRDALATTGLAAVLGLSAVGLAQVAVVVRRALTRGDAVTPGR